ncbi:MAG: homoserine dehydrogenase, partial [Candidatus Methanoperedens sp.]|nr:homoserine dehydrogenase [Candidatus Methanoperedens sp.]
MKTIKISIIGFGSVGQGVARAIMAKKELLNKQGIDLLVVGISDSKGSDINASGIDLEKALARKKEKETIARSKET